MPLISASACQLLSELKTSEINDILSTKFSGTGLCDNVVTLTLTHAILYDTRCYFNVLPKADTEPETKKWKKKNCKVKRDMLRSIGKQSGESGESVVKKKRKASVGTICRKGRFYAWNETAKSC